MGPPSHAPAVITTLSMAVLLACLVAAPSEQPGSTQPVASLTASFDELYRRGYQTGAGIKTLTARFTETTTSSLLTRPLVAHGTLTVQRPSQVALRFADPEQRIVLISGERMTVSWPARNLRQVSNVSSSQNRIQKYLASDSPEELRRQFTIEHRDPGERPGTYEFVLTPKRNRIRDTLARLDLWVDPSSFLLKAIRMTFSNGDTKTMDFEDVVLNVPVAPTTFRLDP
jgi:outer membrane lipoprotein-sorting protein